MKVNQFIARSIMCLAFLCVSFSSLANETLSLETEIEDLKAQMIELNRTLYDLEDQLLYPATTQFAVFVSMADVQTYQLMGVKLYINDELVNSEIYQTEQVEALRRGGIQKIHSGNLKPGLHTLKAEISGKDIDGRASGKVIILEFGKARSSKFLELKITKHSSQNQPKFAIVEWK